MINLITDPFRLQPSYINYSSTSFTSKSYNTLLNSTIFTLMNRALENILLVELSQLFEFVKDVHNTLNDTCTMDVNFIDFTEAFGTVPVNVYS